jgi:uncharacterized protein
MAKATDVRSVEIAGVPALVVKPRGAQALYVFAHGAGAGMQHWFMTGIAEALAERKVATLRYEFPYMAAGKKRVDSPEVAEATVRAVWSEAREKFRKLPAFAGGKSFGGRMTTRAQAAEFFDALRGTVLLGFPLHPAGKPGIERAEHLPRTKGPLLFVQGSRDELADLTLLSPIVEALGKRATLHVIEGADHGFSPKLVPELARIVAEWMDAVLDS